MIKTQTTRVNEVLEENKPARRNLHVIYENYDQSFKNLQITEVEECKQNEDFATEMESLFEKYQISDVRRREFRKINDLSEVVLLNKLKFETAQAQVTETKTKPLTEDKIAGHLYMSYNYDQFKILNGNRNRCPERVRIIMASMMEIGARVVPIVINKKKEIIDGQHRYEAAKLLGLPIYYVSDDDADITTARLINNTQAVWKFLDSIHSWATTGNKNYEKLEDLLTKEKVTGVSAGTAIAAASGIYHNSSNGVTKNMVKEGKFKYTGFQGSKEKTSNMLKETKEMYQLFFNACNKETSVKKDLLMNAMVFLVTEGSVSTEDLKSAIKNQCPGNHAINRETFDKYVHYLSMLLEKENPDFVNRADELLKNYRKTAVGNMKKTLNI